VTLKILIPTRGWEKGILSNGAKSNAYCYDILATGNVLSY